MSEVGTIRGKINDTTTRIARVDSSTNVLTFIDYEHHEVHAGSHFFIKTWTDMTGSAAVKYFHFKTTDSTKWIHARGSITTEDEFRVEIYEDATIATNGTQVYPKNNNRNSTTSASLLCYVDPSVTSDGTLIWDAIVGAGKAIGISSQVGYEIVAKQNSSYLWKITKNNAGTHYIDLDFWFYEHTDKN